MKTYKKHFILCFLLISALSGSFFFISTCAYARDDNRSDNRSPDPSNVLDIYQLLKNRDNTSTTSKKDIATTTPATATSTSKTAATSTGSIINKPNNPSGSSYFFQATLNRFFPNTQYKDYGLKAWQSISLSLFSLILIFWGLNMIVDWRELLRRAFRNINS